MRELRPIPGCGSHHLIRRDGAVWQKKNDGWIRTPVSGHAVKTVKLRTANGTWHWFKMNDVIRETFGPGADETRYPSPPNRIKPIPSCAGYYAGDDGTIWSARKFMGGARGWETGHGLRPLFLWHDDAGYICVGLYLDGKRRSKRVHRLILLAFVGPCPAGKETRHRDNDRGNNRLRNLCWDTHVANMRDQVRYGTRAWGSRCGRSKLKEGDVVSIRKRHRNGERPTALALAFAVNYKTVGAIVRRQNWRHVA